MDLRIVALILSILFISGCENINKQKIGTIAGGAIGAAGGAALGSVVTKDKKLGMAIGAVVGGIAGGIIGNQIGQYLDEEDQKRHSEAVAKALETGQPQVWASPDTGNSGKITVVDVPPLPPPTVQTTSQDETSSAQPIARAPLCRTTTQTIKLKNGETHTEELKACKRPDGTWEAVAA
nr:glycine zipper domain-containing protein [Nitrosomonas nitrosa]